MMKRVLLSLVLIFLIIVLIGSTAPSNFSKTKIVEIKKNSGVSQVAQELANQDIIRSVFLFKVFTLISGGRGKVQAGAYLFDKPQSVIKVIDRVITGSHGLSKVKVTIPEGLNVREIAWVLLKSVPGFDAPGFVALASKDEGYLFPDTYFFYVNAKPQDVIAVMKQNFEVKTKKLQISADIVKMASIVEREATSTIDRKIVAGILWKRLAKGMALQVDPPFYYLFGKDSPDITRDDLKIDSPYNLYLNKGLPPTPIDNPGLGAILDTIEATSSPYWFYLSGFDGRMHYAHDYDGHLTNKQKYIK